ncbi:hypothetical protein DOTSEDRAFT_35394 [Dothistroma septosporum NZE10]|uniref:Protein kinase domain-containing protein n=1 Tax=Dothistroma septosporum (strain NZE10 / CBS 128990) TaxID=675120 RepID=M2YMB7_DOTSN|nr:hypothetical protein DOTSEDRAFT_35394 [Dothistroma septosporum NZE10]
MLNCLNAARGSCRTPADHGNDRSKRTFQRLRNIFTKNNRTRLRDEEQGLMTSPSTQEQPATVYGTFSSCEDAGFSTTLLHQALNDPNVHIDELREYFPDFNGDPIAPVSPDVSTPSTTRARHSSPPAPVVSPVACSVDPDRPASSSHATELFGRLQPTPESFASEYAVIKTLKRNNEGPVHLVRQKRTGKQCIVKQMRYQEASDGTQVDPEEVYLMTQIEHAHRNVVHWVEIIDDLNRGISNLVLEFCAAGDADNLIQACKRRGVRVPEVVVLSIAAALIDAAAFLHHGDVGYDAATSRPIFFKDSSQESILHRDIKPANIFLRWDDDSANYGLPVPVLADFGMAATQRQNQNDSRCGTRDYWSREMSYAYSGALGICSERSDMYAIGVSLFELLTGFPYDPTQDSIQEAFNCSTVRKHPRFLHLLGTCLSTDPDARPAANELHRTSHVFKKHIKEWYEDGNRIPDSFWPAPFANDAYIVGHQPQAQPRRESIGLPPQYSRISSPLSTNAPSTTNAIANLPPLQRVGDHSDFQGSVGAEYAQEIANIPGPFRSSLPKVRTETGEFQLDESIQAVAGAQALRSCFSWRSDDDVEDAVGTKAM